MIKCIKSRFGKPQIVVDCDHCNDRGYVTDESDSQTDRLLAHDWIRNNGWITRKENGKFVQYCETCKKIPNKVITVTTK